MRTARRAASSELTIGLNVYCHADVRETEASNPIVLKLNFAKIVTLVIAGVASLAPALVAQDQSSGQSAAAARPEFEVASVKPVAQGPSDAGGAGRRGGGGCPLSFKMDRGRFDIGCATLRS